MGRAIARALGAAGYRVAVHYHGSEEEAERTVREIREAGGRADPFRADLRDPDAVERLFSELREALGGLDVLINNAAAFPRGRPEEVSVREWDDLFALNLRAPFLCARAARRLMGEAGGSIVNIADVAAFQAWPAYVPYAASKAGLVSLTRGLARAWAPRVRVNAVAPGAVLLPARYGEEERRAAADRAALGRVGRPEDVAQAVLYLLSADYVTGEVVRVDGGAHLLKSAGDA